MQILLGSLTHLTCFIISETKDLKEKHLPKRSNGITLGLCSIPKSHQNNDHVELDTALLPKSASVMWFPSCVLNVNNGILVGSRVCVSVSKAQNG